MVKGVVEGKINKQLYKNRAHVLNNKKKLLTAATELMVRQFLQSLFTSGPSERCVTALANTCLLATAFYSRNK